MRGRAVATIVWSSAARRVASIIELNAISSWRRLRCSGGTPDQARAQRLLRRRPAGAATMEAMPRSIWSGAISFGLVNVPVKVYSAVSPKTVRFHQLDSRTGTRISQRRVNPQTGEEVLYEDLVKGFELTRDRYVVIRPEELDAIAPEKSRTIDIEDFVELSDIDPVYYDHPYWLVPDKGAGKADALLLKAMGGAGKGAVARR